MCVVSSSQPISLWLDPVSQYLGSLLRQVLSLNKKKTISSSLQSHCFDANCTMSCHQMAWARNLKRGSFSELAKHAS